MKKSIFCLALLCLSGCSGKIEDYWPIYEVILVNKSDHDIRLIAHTRYENRVVFDKTLQPDLSLAYPTQDPGDQSPLPGVIASMDVVFDESAQVPYTRKPPYFLLAPADYPQKYDLTRVGNYTKTTTEEGSFIHYTYTFTNGDYEAAREWAERQKDE